MVRNSEYFLRGKYKGKWPEMRIIEITRKLNPPQESDILLYSRNECPFNCTLSSVFCYPPLAEINIGAVVCDRGAWVQPGRRRSSMASGCLLMDGMGMCVGCPPRIKGEFWKHTSVHLSASLAPAPYSPAVRHFHSVIAFRCIFIRRRVEAGGFKVSWCVGWEGLWAKLPCVAFCSACMSQVSCVTLEFCVRLKGSQDDILQKLKSCTEKLVTANLQKRDVLHGSDSY